jgi:hypothetical protein
MGDVIRFPPRQPPPAQEDDAMQDEFAALAQRLEEMQATLRGMLTAWGRATAPEASPADGDELRRKAAEHRLLGSLAGDHGTSAAYTALGVSEAAQATLAERPPAPAPMLLKSAGARSAVDEAATHYVKAMRLDARASLEHLDSAAASTMRRPMQLVAEAIAEQVRAALAERRAAAAG